MSKFPKLVPLALKNTMLAIALLAALIMFAYIDPIPQDTEYHQFSEDLPIVGIPNFWNVFSNIGFVLTGILGLYHLSKNKMPFALISAVLFIGIAATGMGSAYYHALPDNYTLMWDRIPMTIVFSSFFCLMYGIFISKEGSYKLWFVLLPIGVLSVVYWYYSETMGAGDLRPYALVQFLPLILLFLLLFLSDQNTSFVKKKLLPVLLFYCAAKFAEHFDYEIYQFTKIISGHPVKHFLASISTFYMYLLVKNENFYKIA